MAAMPVRNRMIGLGSELAPRPAYAGELEPRRISWCAIKARAIRNVRVERRDASPQPPSTGVHRDTATATSTRKSVIIVGI